MLQVKGEMIISQYAEQASLDNGWLNTNDLAKIDGKILRISGRNDHVIIRSGENIPAEAIEQLLSKIPDVDDIAIAKYGAEKLSDERGDSLVVLISNKHKKIDIGFIKNWIKENIKSFYQPDYILQVDEIPRTLLGKIKRGEVQKIVNDSPSFYISPL